MTFGLIEAMVTAIGSGLLASLLLVFLACAGFELWRLRGKGLATIVEDFRLDPAGESGVRIFIRARAAGVIGKILHTLGLERGTLLTVTDQEISLDRVGLTGFKSQYVPIDHVASSGCEFYRALSFLALAFLSCGFGFFSFLVSLDASNDYARQDAFRAATPLLLSSAAWTGILYLVYRFSKRVVLSVETFGGARIGLSYKRSIIDGAAVELEQAVQAVLLLNSAIGEQAHPPRPMAMGR